MINVQEIVMRNWKKRCEIRNSTVMLMVRQWQFDWEKELLYHASHHRKDPTHDACDTD